MGGCAGLCTSAPVGLPKTNFEAAQYLCWCRLQANSSLIHTAALHGGLLSQPHGHCKMRTQLCPLQAAWPGRYQRCLHAGTFAAEGY